METKGFPGGAMVKNLPANAGDACLIPGSGRSPGGGNGNPLQYFCLGNPMDRRVHGVPKELDTTWQLNNNNMGFPVAVMAINNCNGTRRCVV